MTLGYFRLRKIIPSALKTQPAVTPEEQKKKVLSLYRLCLRYSTEIQTIYPLDVPLPKIRQKFRQLFEKNRFLQPSQNTQHFHLVNQLIMKGTMELEEMLYMWKTQSHVMRYFKDDWELKKEKEKGFLESFYEGK